MTKVKQGHVEATRPIVGVNGTRHNGTRFAGTRPCYIFLCLHVVILSVLHVPAKCPWNMSFVDQHLKRCGLKAYSRPPKQENSILIGAGCSVLEDCCIVFRSSVADVTGSCLECIVESRSL